MEKLPYELNFEIFKFFNNSNLLDLNLTEKKNYNIVKLINNMKPLYFNYNTSNLDFCILMLNIYPVSN